jgi:hypothetical protein
MNTEVTILRGAPLILSTAHHISRRLSGRSIAQQGVWLSRSVYSLPPHRSLYPREGPRWVCPGDGSPSTDLDPGPRLLSAEIISRKEKEGDTKMLGEERPAKKRETLYSHWDGGLSRPRGFAAGFWCGGERWLAR